jgi:hypothetical protein
MNKNENDGRGFGTMIRSNLRVTHPMFHCAVESSVEENRGAARKQLRPARAEKEWVFGRIVIE